MSLLCANNSYGGLRAKVVLLEISLSIARRLRPVVSAWAEKRSSALETALIVQSLSSKINYLKSFTPYHFLPTGPNMLRSVFVISLAKFHKSLRYLHSSRANVSCTCGIFRSYATSSYCLSVHPGTWVFSSLR